MCGGVSWETTALTTIEAYDTKTNKWRKVPDMPTPRFLLAVTMVRIHDSMVA